MPHRLQLTVKATLKEMPDILKVDDTISSLINSYGSYKRRAHLHQQASKKELKLFELHNIFRQRWIFSDYSAVKAIIGSWKLFVTDLKDILITASLKNDWPQAEDVLNKITSRAFMFKLHFMMDLLTQLKTVSKIAQKSAGILIGKEALLRDLINMI